jgi:signal transduction histidine kinase
MKKERKQGEFDAESVTLDEAQTVLRGNPSPAELEAAYRKLVSDYERLLKTTVKISRISDIQGRMLLEREQELKAATASLTLAENRRKKLVSDISHELGTPMTSIQGYVMAMIDRVIPADRDYLQMIYGKVQFVNRLVNDLFQLSRIEANKVPFSYRIVTPEELLRPYDRKFAVDALEAGLRLTVGPIVYGSGVGSRRIAVKADPFRIEQVMTNFVHNAIKFTPRGGLIRIEAEVRRSADADSGGDGEIQGGRFTSDGGFGSGGGPSDGAGTLTVRVADTGIGIRAENLPHVFERFYRVRQPEGEGVPGTGLGLAISKEIVLQHNGSIGVHSEPEAGSAFYFTLPLCD